MDEPRTINKVIKLVVYTNNRLYKRSCNKQKRGGISDKNNRPNNSNKDRH